VRLNCVELLASRFERRGLAREFLPAPDEGTITAFATLEEARANGAMEAIFTSEEELAKFTALWPISRYAEHWDSFAVRNAVQLRPRLVRRSFISSIR
jgi:hypothetical protein